MRDCTAVRLTLRNTNSAFQFVSQLNIIQKPENPLRLSPL